MARPSLPRGPPGSGFVGRRTTANRNPAGKPGQVVGCPIQWPYARGDPIMKQTKVSAAIVGLGFGAEFIPIWQRHPSARLHAICQRNSDKMKKVGDAFKVEKRYTRYQDVLGDPEVTVVHINSPIPDHAPMSIAALQAGKHV